MAMSEGIGSPPGYETNAGSRKVRSQLLVGEVGDSAEPGFAPIKGRQAREIAFAECGWLDTRSDDQWRGYRRGELPCPLPSATSLDVLPGWRGAG